MALVGAGLAVAEYFGIRAVKWATVAITAGMTFELFRAIYKSKIKKKIITYAICSLLFALLICSAYHVGGRPWIILLILMTIAGADIGGWLFGKLIGGAKLWPELSPRKTWAGEIAGIALGTFACLMYGFLGADMFVPQLLWIGMSVSLLSQYGDLTASWLKRKLGIKDFGTTLPGHGGLMDRFDGWIYVLPIVWLVML